MEWSKWERDGKEADRGHVTKPVTRRCWTWGKYRILSCFLSHLVPSLGRRELEIPQLSSMPSLIGWKLFQALGGNGAVWSQPWGRKMQILTLECWGLRDRSRGSWRPPPHGIIQRGLLHDPLVLLAFLYSIESRKSDQEWVDGFYHILENCFRGLHNF